MLFLLPRAHLRLTGSDRVRYLNGQITQNILFLSTDRSLPACITDAKGRLQAELWVAASPDALLIDTASELSEFLLARLDKYLISDDAVVQPDPDTVLLHSLVDPETLPLLAPFVRRSAARLGIPGWDIRLNRSLWAHLEAPLAPLLESGETWESLRVFHGIPVWGKELDSRVLPPEAGLDLTHIDYHKGCYIGQEVLSRIKSVGRVNRKLIPWRLGSFLLPPAGSPFYLSNPQTTPGAQEVGSLTSSSMTPEGPRALGYLKHGISAPVFFLASGEEIFPLSLETTFPSKAPFS